MQKEWSPAHITCPGTDQVWGLSEVLNACMRDQRTCRQAEVQRGEREREREDSAI